MLILSELKDWGSRMDRIRIFILKHYKNLIKLAVALVIIALILFEGKTQFQSISPASALHIIRSVPVEWMILFLLFGIFASYSMVLYDVLGVKAFQFEVRKDELLIISFVANTVNILLGLGGLTGASIKTLLLKKSNIDFKQMISYNTLLVTSATTGLSFYAIIALLNFNSITALFNQYKWLWICLTAFGLYLILYFFLDRFVRKFKDWANAFGTFNLFKLRLRLMAVSILEWTLAGILFYLIACYFHANISFMTVMSVFIVSAIAGIISFLPGGAGSFDLIAIVGLHLSGLTSDQALTVVILYRIFYYFIPALTAIVVFSLRILSKSEKKEYVITSNVFGQFVATIMAIIVFSCGIVLLSSALAPSLITRINLISDFLSVSFLQFSRSISIAIGLMLLITSREIYLRVQRAYYVVMILLFAGGIFTFIKGLDIEELIFILIAMGIIRLSKNNFYRKSVPGKLSYLIFTTLSLMLILIVYLKISHLLFFNYVIKYDYPYLAFYDIRTFVQSGIIAYVLLIVFVLIWYLKSKSIKKDILYQGVNQEKLEQFLKKNRGHHLSHLLYLGDKQLFWAADDQVLFAYSKFKSNIFVLGDPIGEKSLIPRGIQEFQSFLDLYGYRAIFYQVEEDNLSLYHDYGYYFFKLGEEAIVDLQSFEMTGSNRSSFRNTLKRFEKDGFTFEIMYPPYNNATMDELKLISDEWLGKRNEMGFSIGWFDISYLQKAPIAVVRSQSENKILSFVSLIYHDQQKECIGIDLMRYKKEVPNSTMDFIFIQLLIYFKEMGYHYFSFGVAPLSKVGYAPFSHKSEKVVHFIYRHGKLIYSFEGLRKYKEKFDPAWEPRFLAYPKLMSLPALLIEISQLINSSKKRLQKKIL